MVEVPAPQQAATVLIQACLDLEDAALHGEGGTRQHELEFLRAGNSLHTQETLNPDLHPHCRIENLGTDSGGILVTTRDVLEHIRTVSGWLSELHRLKECALDPGILEEKKTEYILGGPEGSNTSSHARISFTPESTRTGSPLQEFLDPDNGITTFRYLGKPIARMVTPGEISEKTLVSRADESETREFPNREEAEFHVRRDIPGVCQKFHLHLEPREPIIEIEDRKRRVLYRVRDLEQELAGSGWISREDPDNPGNILLEPGPGSESDPQKLIQSLEPVTARLEKRGRPRPVWLLEYLLSCRPGKFTIENPIAPGENLRVTGHGISGRFQPRGIPCKPQKTQKEEITS